MGFCAVHSLATTALQKEHRGTASEVLMTAQRL